MDLANANLMEIENFSNYAAKPSADLYKKATAQPRMAAREMAAQEMTAREYVPAAVNAFDDYDKAKMGLESQVAKDGAQATKAEASTETTEMLLGMPKTTGIIVVSVTGVVLIIGGYFLYKKMKG